MPQLPLYLPILFVVATLVNLFLFYQAVKRSSNKLSNKRATVILIGLTVWLALQAVLSTQYIYSKQLDALPPKIFLFGLLPTILITLLLFLTQKGRAFVDGLSLPMLTAINIVRIPVEIGLLLLYLNKTVPIEMTFEGWNFDIIMGLTAPLVLYFGFYKQKISNRLLLAWHIVGVLLLAIIVITAFLAAPFPLQQIAFEQPNIAVLHFPYVWLPTFIVPSVFFGHFVSIRRLLK